MAGHVVESEFRRQPNARSEDVAVDLAEQLHIAERLAALAVGQIVVVEAECLLVDGIVDPARVDRQHRRAVVVHEVAADLVGRIGEAARRRPEKDGRRIDGARAEDDELRRQRFRLAVLTVVDRADRLAVGRSFEALHHRTGGELDARVLQRNGKRGAFSVHLPAAGIGEGIPRRASAGQPLIDVDSERQRRRMQAEPFQFGARPRDRRFIRYRREGVGF